jgi:Fic family protein
MDASQYTSTRAGRIQKQVTDYNAFIPSPLPPLPALIMDAECLSLLSQADRSLGRLNGLASIISDPDLFVYLYVRKEALLSSQIEGTQCSLEDVLVETENQATQTGKDIEEVSNYVAAMNEGLSRLQEIPISTRLIREMHGVLMRGVRGHTKTPGEFRTSQNWIGPPNATLSSAQYVPPPPDDAKQAMSDLEKYIHQDDSLPPLIKAALVHAQFETIHPFLDGNGRLGRLLITFVLCNWRVMEKPLLYLSYFFKANRTEYYARLMAIRSKGDWENWVKFFLRGVHETAQMACQAALDIHALHQRDSEAIRSNRANASVIQVFHAFCRFPGATINDLLRTIPNSNIMTLNRSVKTLIAQGVLKQIGANQRNRRFIYPAYMEILTRDTATKIG